jgi:hypothetical protein
MFHIVWRYEVKESAVKTFEHEYGENGAWAHFFSTSTKFAGSILSRDLQNNFHYVIIDQWMSKEDYETFLSENKQRYDELSETTSILYKKEQRLGEFKNV